MTLKSLTGRLARWVLALQPYNLKITYTPDKANVVADTLSRTNCHMDNQESCDICSFVADLPTRWPKEKREEETSDPEVANIVKCFENTDHSELTNWTARGYMMDSGVLYCYVPDQDCEEPQLVVPESVRVKIIAEYHDAPSAGLYGHESTLAKISKKNF